MSKTSAKDFEKFKEECQLWIDFFGLHGWAVTYDHGDTSLIIDSAQACYELDDEGRVVCITLDENVDDHIDILAFHEVVEALLLGELKALAQRRFLANSEQIEEAGHRVVRILENKIFKNKNKFFAHGGAKNENKGKNKKTGNGKGK